MAELTRAKTKCQMKLEIPEKELLYETSLKFDQVIESPTKRKYFSEYLQESGGGSEAVLGVWEAIEDMRYVEKNLLHEVGTRIFYTFINRPVPALSLDRNIIRRVESFLVGDSSHQVQGVPKQSPFSGFLDSLYIRGGDEYCRQTENIFAGVL